MDWGGAIFGHHCFTIQLVPSYLSVGEVVLAELLPQQAILSERPQLQTHLSQAEQVPAVRQTLHDVQL